MRAVSIIAAMEWEPPPEVNRPGPLFLDAQTDLGGENDSNRLPRGVFRGLIAMDAPPRSDPGTIALDRGAPRLAPGLEGSKHRLRRDIRCRINRRPAPHHYRPHRETPKI